MKTNLKHISRRTISLILCVLMLFSTLMVGSISTANATTYCLAGEMNSWSNTSNPFENGKVSFELLGNKTYEFKIVQSGTWDNALGKNDTIKSTNCSNLVFTTSEGNCKIETTIAGTYVFNFDSSNNTVSVTYPVQQTTTKKIYIKNTIGWGEVSVYMWKGNDKNANWPGVKASASTAYADYNYEYTVTNTSWNTFILNNNDNGKQTDNINYNYSGNIWVDIYESNGVQYTITETEPITYYPVNFGSNGNGTVSAKVGSNTIEDGSRQPSDSSVTFTATAVTGYELEGWYSDSTCTNKISGASGTTYTTDVNSETNVYAKFKETLHTVSIVGGTSTSTTAGIATQGTATVNKPTGKTFTGWSIPTGISLASGYDKYSTTIEFTATSDDLTVAANFEDIYTVSVTKSTGVASFTPNTIEPQKANAVVTITPTYVDGYEYSAPTVTNGTFVQDGNKINVTVSGTGPVTIQLNASPKTFNVTFNSDGGSECSAVQATYNSKYPTLPTPTRNGYTFNGWYNGETKINSGDTVSITSDTVLQAHWTIKTPTITGAPTQITAKTGEQFTVTGVTTDSFADLSYTFNDATNTTGTFTAPATSGNYTLTITATHNSDSNVKATSNVTVKVSDAFTTSSADITYYVDMHTNTGTPSIVVNGVETALTKQGDSTVYSATVSTPYSKDSETNNPIEILGNIGMKVGDAVYPVNGLGVGCITTGKVWLEANGKLSTTTVQVKKTESNGEAGGKRIYFTNTKGWENVYLYAFSTDNNQLYEKKSWPGEAMTSTGWQDNVTGPYIYYFDVPSTYNKIVISNGKADKDPNKRQTVDISIASATTTTSNHFYINGDAISDGNDYGKYNVGTVNAIAPKISKYYSEVTLSTSDMDVNIMPSDFSAAILTAEDNRKNIYFEVTSGTDVISVDSKTGVITPLKAGTAEVKIFAYGTYSVTGSNSDSVTANVIVGENTVVGGFDVMSYDSVQSTFTAQNGSISSVSTSLVGSKFSSLPISGAGIVTNDGKTYTVLYAAANSTTGYGSLKLNVTAVSQPSADTYEFKKWTKDSVDTTGSATATFPVDGGAYKAVYEQIARTTITITYKYNVYNTSDNVYYYDPNKTRDEKTQTYTTSVIGTPSNDDIKQIAIDNIPKNLDNDYFDYTLNESNIAISGANATVTLTETAHEYSVYIMSSKKTIQYKRTYQHFIDASSADFGFAEGTDVIWYQSNKNGDLVSVLSTGTNYRFRAVADNQYIYVVENKDQVSMNGSSAVISTGNKITTVNDIDKLNQDFYIADYFNGYAMGHDDVQFVGAGVMYYSVDANTGAPSNTTLANSGLVNSSGVGDRSAMEQFLVSRLGTFNNSVNVTTDSATKLGYRYLTAADGADIFRYSDALEAYQYIFTLTFTNSAVNASKNVRLYSYFVYSYKDSNGATQYVVSISDGYAQAQMYVSK